MFSQNPSIAISRSYNIAYFIYPINTARRSWDRSQAPVYVELACSLLCMHGFIFSGFSGFLQQSKEVQIRSAGYSKLPLGVNVRVNGCPGFGCSFPSKK